MAGMTLGLLVGLLGLLGILQYNMGAYVKLTNAVCESKNESWVIIDQCRLRAISRNRTDLTIEVTVLYPARNIHLRFKMEKKANGYKPWLFDYTIDTCAFMRKINHPVLRIIYDMIKPYSTINHTCPYIGKQALRNFHYDPVNLTLPVPTGDYRVLLSWIFDGKIQFTTNVYFHFEQDISKD